jgi:hypothetical protein
VIDHDLHLAVGHVHLAALEVAQARAAQRDFFHGGGRAVDLDGVPDHELVLDEDERPGDDVAHEELAAEAERRTQDAGADQQRLHVPAEDVESVDEPPTRPRPW